MASFDFRATIYQVETLTHASADTKDEEEAMMEVAGHGASVTCVFEYHPRIVVY